MGTGLSAPSAQLLGRCAQGRGEGARGLHVGTLAARCDSRRQGNSRAQGMLDVRTEHCAGANRRDDGWAGVLDRRNNGTEKNRASGSAQPSSSHGELAVRQEKGGGERKEAAHLDEVALRRRDAALRRRGRRERGEARLRRRIGETKQRWVRKLGVGCLGKTCSGCGRKIGVLARENCAASGSGKKNSGLLDPGAWVPLGGGDSAPRADVRAMGAHAGGGGGLHAGERLRAGARYARLGCLRARAGAGRRGWLGWAALRARGGGERGKLELGRRGAGLARWLRARRGSWDGPRRAGPRGSAGAVGRAGGKGEKGKGGWAGQAGPGRELG
eukprot:XP_020401129.1 spidroin-1-like [Zea mays]